ncbi:MAG: hypothetical protein LBF01_05210 [Bacteroidales bacterium]|nr:hypothetical protein [Bacteroidales bacterium]
MGTLLDQRPRESHGLFDEAKIDSFISLLKDTSNKYKLSMEQTIDVFKLMSRERQNELYYVNGDIHDEQMTGLGKIFQDGFEKISNSIDEISEKLDK